MTLWLNWATGIGPGEFWKGTRICKVGERIEWKDDKNAEIEGELLMMGYKVKEGRRCTWVEGRALRDLWRNRLILQMTGADNNITERNCCQRNGTNRSYILQKVSFKAFSFIFNFIQLLRFHSTPQRRKICNPGTVSWQHFSKLYKNLAFKGCSVIARMSQGMNVKAGNIFCFIECFF